MRIELITNLFDPDKLAGASLFTDMALYLRDQGHDVWVTTTFSYYPAWALQPEDKGTSVRDEVFQGIPVRRVHMYVPRRVTGATRLLSDLSFLFSLLRYGRHRGRHPEIVVTAMPMLSQCLAQRFLYAGQKIPRFIAVKDFVVEAALDLGILKAPGFAPLLYGLQRWALRSAQALSTISPYMLERLERNVGKDRPISVIPDWIHKDLQTEIDRQMPRAPARTPGLLFYSGNLGVKQGLPGFIDQFHAASGTELGWSLRINGGGAEKNLLESAVATKFGTRIGPVQEEEGYVRSLLEAAAYLVTQRPGVGANFLPSKLLPALATGTPVLAVCDFKSPLGKEVLDGGFGEVVAPGDAATLKAVLQKWKHEPGSLVEMSQAARKWAKRYERKSVLGLYEAEFVKLVNVPAPSQAGNAESLSDSLPGKDTPRGGYHPLKKRLGRNIGLNIGEK
jgi:colanic acid biosynthesis glycosyl transferase WcaI